MTLAPALLADVGMTPARPRETPSLSHAASSPSSRDGLFAVSRRLVLAAALAAPALGGAFVAAAAEFAPRGPRLVAIFPPWWDGAQALAAASDVAPVAGVGGFGFAVGVVAREAGTTAALRARGAWFVADGALVPSCFRPTRTSP